jgi:hypothetical protein
MRAYARCVAGLEDVWIARMDASLRPAADPQGRTAVGKASGNDPAQFEGQHEADANEEEEGQK